MIRHTLHQWAKGLRSTLFVFFIVSLFPCPAASDVLNYTYDDMHRLIRVEYETETAVDRTYDALGNRLSVTISQSAPSNTPPDTPGGPSPVNTAIDINPSGVMLNWNGGDPDSGDSVSYDVYFGETSEPDLVKRSLPSEFFTTGTLKSMTTYYWQIRAKDNHYARTDGPVWSFTTGNTPPLTPVEPSPATDSAIIVYGNVYLSWDSVQDPNEGDSVTYDIYYGTSPTPALVQSDATDTTYNIGALEPDSTFYWKIVTKDNHGATTEGPVWTFNTIDHEVQVIGYTIYSSDTTLTKAGGPYVISGNLTVAEGVVLTIEPGTVLKFRENTGMTINGTLSAQGTQEDKIIFTSYRNDRFGGDTNGDGNATPPSPGDWNGINFSSSSDDSLFEYCVVEYAGGSSGAIYFHNTSPTIRDSIIRHSSGNGIRVYGGSPTISGNSIVRSGSRGIDVYSGSPIISGNSLSGNANYDIYYKGTGDGTITNNSVTNGIFINTAIGNFTNNTINYNNAYPLHVYADDVGKLMNNNTFINIDSESYLEVTGGTISHDAIWPATLSYHVLGNITVMGTDGDDALTTLTISQGAELRFNQNKSLTIGDIDANYDPGALIAQGTAENKIIFTANQEIPTAGDWYGIKFDNTSDDSTSMLAHCIVEYAGDNSYGEIYSSVNYSAVNINQASPTITNTVISHVDRKGVGIYVYSGSPTISGNSIISSGANGIHVESGSPTISNNSIMGSGANGIHVWVASDYSVISGNNLSGGSDYDIYYHNYVVSAVGIITNNTVENGIFSYGNITLSDNTIQYNNTYPVRVNPDYVGELLNSNTITNIDNDSYIEVGGGTISHDVTWPTTFSYHILGDITVQGTNGDDSITTLTIDPGTELKFSRGSQLIIGQNDADGDPGALIARGTAQDTILFTSNQWRPAAGDWDGILFDNTSDDSTSVLEYCIIEYAGDNRYNEIHSSVNINQASPTITNTTIRYSSDYGIYVQSGSPVISGNNLSGGNNYDIYYNGTADGVISNNTVENGIFSNNNITLSDNIISYNNAYPVRVHADYVGDLLNSNTITNTDNDSYIEVTGGTVSHDTTWTAMFSYHILGDIKVQGTDGDDNITTLTIDPGTELKFNRDCQLIIGQIHASGDPGALIARGTTQNTILFTSNLWIPAAGDWDGIKFHHTSDDATSVLEHSIVEYAGYYNAYRAYWSGAVEIYSSSPNITNTTINHSEGHGIRVSYGGSPTISNNSIIGSSSDGIRVSDGSPTISNNSIIGSSSDGIRVSDGSPTISDNSINGSNSDGIHVESGSPTISDNSIIGSGVNGIHVASDSSVISGNNLSGGNNYDIYYNGTADGVISNNTVENGIFSNSNITLSDNTIQYNNTYPVRVHPDNVGELLHSNTITNTDNDSYIEVTGGTVSHDTTWTATFSYHILGDITVQGTDGNDSITTLTIDPGTELKFNQDSQLIIGQHSSDGDPGALIASGTAADNIIFTSNQETPAAGDWYGILFDNTSDDATSVLDHSIVEYTGGHHDTNEAVYIRQSSPSIVNSTIHHGLYIGIYVVSGSPTITGNSIVGYGINGYGGIFNETPQFPVTAENNWWGDASGPYDPSNADGLHNPDGTGSSVGDYVDYDPWLTSMPISDDTDNDGISDSDEVDIYGTDPNNPDTDEDGINDGDELTYWGASWNDDSDGDGIINLLDADSDNDGIQDGVEIAQGTDPADANTIYENAEDGDTVGWDVYDDDPAGAVITNIYDDDRSSRVIEFTGTGASNGYRLRNPDNSWWNNDAHKTIQWSMNYSENFTVFIAVQTTDGFRYIYYNKLDHDNLGTDRYIHHGLGATAKDGSWHTFTRDLEFDLKDAQPDNNLEAILGFLIRGSGRIDDIKTMTSFPVNLDTDNDGITDFEERTSYGTHPYDADTDGDGIADGDELTYWGDIWYEDADGDGVINLLDADADDDGILDGAEIEQGTDPADANSMSVVIMYEDAENGDTTGWMVYDNDPAGAVINNVDDIGWDSKVIEFTGSGGSNGYRLRNPDGSWWNNSAHKTIQWSMNYSENFTVYIAVQTTDGFRYIYYNILDYDNLGTDRYIHHGLGATAKDGNWHTFTRDLEYDLKEAQPDNNLEAILGFLIRGSGKVDDINTFNQ